MTNGTPLSVNVGPQQRNKTPTGIVTDQVKITPKHQMRRSVSQMTTVQLAEPNHQQSSNSKANVVAMLTAANANGQRGATSTNTHSLTRSDVVAM